MESVCEHTSMPRMGYILTVDLVSTSKNFLYVSGHHLVYLSKLASHFVQVSVRLGI